MAKFKPFDRFSVSENGLTGHILDVVYDLGTNNHTYEVVWDHLPHSGSALYTAKDSDDLWDLIGQIKGDQEVKAENDEALLPSGDHRYWYGMPVDKMTFPKTCEHKWVEVGFQFTKIVCYHCDIEKT